MIIKHDSTGRKLLLDEVTVTLSEAEACAWLRLVGERHGVRNSIHSMRVDIDPWGGVRTATLQVHSDAMRDQSGPASDGGATNG